MNENWLVVVEPKGKRNKEVLRTVVVLYSAKSKAEALRKYRWDYGWLSNPTALDYKKPVAVRALEGVEILI